MVDIPDRTVGDRIRIKRKELNMTKAELSKKINISIEEIKRWEKNEMFPGTYMLLKLCKALNCNTIYILGSSRLIAIRKLYHSSHILDYSKNNE